MKNLIPELLLDLDLPINIERLNKEFNYPTNRFFIPEVSHRRANNLQYRKFRLQIVRRDGKCVVCGRKNLFTVHHILSYKLFPTLRTCLDNALTICSKCIDRYYLDLHPWEKNNEELNKFLKEAKICQLEIGQG